MRPTVAARPRTPAWVVRLLPLVAATGCATPRYVQFYERYAGTCQVSAQEAKLTEPSSDPQFAPIKAAFVHALDDHADELRNCYVDALRYGETHGTIRLAIQLHTSGHAGPVTLLADTTSFPPLACCVMDVVRQTRVAVGDPVADVGFVYPFSFRTVRTTTLFDSGLAWSRWGAHEDGFRAELDESTLAIGGVLMYSVAADGVHYHSDREASDAAKAGRPER